MVEDVESSELGRLRAQMVRLPLTLPTSGRPAKVTRCSAVDWSVALRARICSLAGACDAERSLAVLKETEKEGEIGCYGRQTGERPTEQLM